MIGSELGGGVLSPVLRLSELDETPASGRTETEIRRPARRQIPTPADFLNETLLGRSFGVNLFLK